MTNELELDKLFWKTISTNQEFQSWFISRTKFAHRAVELVMDEIWHQKWYRDPMTKKDSETDIFLVFKESETGERYGVHIENKPLHRVWEPLQPENYRKRAEHCRDKWGYTFYQLILIAPREFLKKSSREILHFDNAISYEDIGHFIPEFKHACATKTLPVINEPTEEQLLKLRALQALLHGLIRMRMLEYRSDPNLELPDLVTMFATDQLKLWFPVPGMAGGLDIRLVAGQDELAVFAESDSRIWGGGMRHKITMFNIRSEPYDYLEEPAFDEWVAKEMQPSTG